MRTIVSLFCALVLLLVFIITVAFTQLNSTPIAISIGFVEFSARPLAFWVVGSFVLGGLLGLMSGIRLVRSIKLRLKINRLSKKLRYAEKELSRLASKYSETT